jgi:acyl carrier protein
VPVSADPVRDAIHERLRALAGDQVDLSSAEVGLDADFMDDLGMDSLGLIEFQMSVEEAFDLTLPDERVDQIRTVRAAGELVLAARASAPED